MAIDATRVANQVASPRDDRTLLGARSLIGLLSLLVVVGVFASYSSLARYSLNQKNAMTSDLEHRVVAQSGADSPLKLGVVARSEQAIILAADETEWLSSQMVPTKDPMSQGLCHHMLYLHGLNASFEHESLQSGNDLLRLFVSAKASQDYFGESSVTRTRHGVRFPTFTAVDKSGEVHRDQTLALMGYLGLSISFPIEVDEQPACIADVIADSLANFDLNQREIEWTAWAYAHYLPPVKSWTNRYHETFGFDDLVERLINSSLPGASCGGAHVLMSLTMIYRADSIRPILSPVVRTRLQELLREAVASAVNEQQPDGHWRLDWNSGLFADKSPRPTMRDGLPEQLLATGHLAEWLLHIPAELQPPAETYRQAAVWLFQALRSADLNQRAMFCPVTHGLFFLHHAAVMPESCDFAKSGCDR